jgi:carboxypeptidase Q
MPRTVRHALFLCVLAATVSVLAQERIDTDINAKIRTEATDHSQIMRTLHFLTDVYSPRLTGSPTLKAAEDWTLKQLTEWGFSNAHLEPWDFGHPGWANDRFAAFIVSPVKQDIIGEALAWTPSTPGPVTATVLQMVIPETPAQEQLTAYLDGMKTKVRGKIVLVGKHQIVAVDFSPPPLRIPDEQARKQFDPNAPPQPPPTPPAPQGLTAAQINEQVDRFLLANGALVRVNDAARPHGQVRVFANRTYDVTKAPPTIVIRNEDYGRISRILADGTPVSLEVNVVNRSFPLGKTAYNAIAELPGTDKKDEVIMLGGHIDAWHDATGAVDNATGCAVMMEAARILHAIGAPNRRTIRVALWSAEEQGLLGSQAYVKEHFGMFENPKPEYFKFGGYLNIDSGTGRPRGFTVFGPPEAGTILREIVAPFEDLGVVGAIATDSRRRGGTDSTSFNEAGLPGIGIRQDPIEYQTVTWHTNLNTFERVLEPDLKQAAISIASVLYHLANRDDLLPRFGKENMPPLPKP